MTFLRKRIRCWEKEEEIQRYEYKRARLEEERRERIDDEIRRKVRVEEQERVKLRKLRH